MKRIGFILFLALLSAGLWANIRAPYFADQSGSGIIEALRPVEGVRLGGERMSIVFPDMDIRETGLDSYVSVEVEYSLVNVTDHAILVPVAFAVPRVRDAVVAVNDYPVEYGMDQNVEMFLEYIFRIIRHRGAFMPTLYAGLLEQVRTELGIEAWPSDFASFRLLFPERPDAEALASLIQAPYSQFLMDFQDLVFDINLQPGENSVTVRYEQGLYVQERSSSYRAPTLAGSIVGIDYLLYPADSWTLSPDFRFTLEVEISDYIDRFLFFRSYTRPTVHCNLELTPNYNRTTHRTSFRGEYDSFPDEILTILVEKLRD